MISFERLKNEYERNWAGLEIRAGRLAEANAVARKALNGKATYQQIERLTGVPWFFTALCHYRESNFDFDTYLGNGESLHRVTKLVPKGRGPLPRSWTEPWTRSESRTSLARTIGALRG